MPDLLVVADDLSGATEAAAAFLLRTTRISVRLSADGSESAHDAQDLSVLAVDTDSRHGDATAAAEAAEGTIRAATRGLVPTTVVKKVDSLLRGHPGAEVAALAEHLGRVPVVATALPSAGRTAVDGVLRVHGTALHETDLWRAEPRDAPRDLAAGLAPLTVHVVPLSTVRSESLASHLGDLVGRGLVPVCDGETDADLDAVVSATASLRDRVLLVGSGALASAVAASLPVDPLSLTTPPGPSTTTPRPDGTVVAVVGTAAPVVATQLDAAEAGGAIVLRLDPGELLTDPTTVEAAVLAHRGTAVVVLALDPRSTVRPGEGRALSAALARCAHPLTSRADGLVLTGGETARAVLTTLGVDRLTPLRAAPAGAVLSRTRAGTPVVTRPGSLGGPDGLLDLLSLLDTTGPATPPTPDRSRAGAGPTHASGPEPATTSKETR